MTEEEHSTILMIKGAISELPPEKQQKCVEFTKLINEASKGYEDCMILAIALCGAVLLKEA